MRNKIYALLLLLFTTLVTQAQTSLLPGSLLADANDETTLSTWLNNNCAVGTLLYRKSVHGANSSTFHSLCDNQGPTLVLIKNDATNTVFGGFANASWVSGYYGYYGWYGQYISAPGSFLFNLTTDQKADLINPNDYYAMYGNNNLGPVFGGGHDIFMSSDMTYVQVNGMGYTYQCMAGTIYNPACWEALVGAGSNDYFNAGEVEVYKVELCGIKTGNVANAAYCAGNNISVDFTSVGITYTAGNVFTAELSDASGSFASPVSIGTLTSTANAGTINAVLPAGITSGNGYKVRVVSSQNGVQSLNTSNAFIVGHQISTSISTTNHCPGSAVAVNYIVSGCALGAGNVFTAELSDENGSFASPVVLGTLATNSGSGTINATLPGNVLVGNHSYSIRVNSSQPASTALSSAYISIGNKTSISYSGSLCVGSVVNINYSYTGCPLAPGNVFNVEMSNASGSFASPIVIGTLTSNATSGTIPVALPANTANGSGYKMRLTTSNPVSVYMHEENFSVGSSDISAYYIGGQMCAGGTATVTYDANGCLNAFQSGNVFTVQLSNASGSFASPINIGTRTTTDPDGSINVTLPANIASANYYNGYQIRVVSSNPAITGNGNSVWADAGITDIYLTSYPSGGLCANGSIALGFQIYGCTPYSSNIYRLQMSTTSAFTSTTNIGSLTSTATSGTVTGTIPAGTTGIRYFRVVSTSPVQLSSDYFSKNVGQPVITVGTVANDCAGSMLPVPYTTSGCAYGSGNVFTVELSSSGGSFSTPVALGTVASTAASGTLNVGNIPSSTSYGNYYRVRVKSSNPASDWAYSSYFTIGRQTNVYPNTNHACPGASVGFYYYVDGCAPSSGNTYTLQLSTNTSFSSPTTLTTLVSQATSGTINATIPSGLAAGTYYIRIRTSNANGSLFNYDYFYVGLQTDITSVTTSPYCPGTAGVVTYTSTGCTPQSGNVFRVEMDDDYNFGSPTVIGTRATTSTGTTIPVTWPTTLPAGSYYLRVMSSNPGTGYANYYGSISYGSFPYITNSYLSTQCPGAAIALNYTTYGCTTIPAGNVFTAELSDGNGYFTSPIVIGSSATTAATGTVNVTLPTNLPAGNYYRIRLVSNKITVREEYYNYGFTVSGTMSVTGTVSSQCAGGTFNLGYNATGCPPQAGNTFTVELSDASGNFSASPTVIGTLSSTAATGNIPCSIPANTPQGGSYRVRVNSSNPGTTSPAYSNYFQIGYTLSITGLASGYCPGSVIPVNYSSTCAFYPGNVLSVFLSDAFGDFTYGTQLAAVSTTASSGVINITLPQNIAGGSGYRLQVKSTNPVALNSVISNPFTVGLTTALSAVSSPQCPGSSFNVNYTATGCPVNPGNVYQVMLGNTVVGTLIGNAASGTIPVTLPANLAGGYYNLRVVSTSPVPTSTSSISISVGSAASIGTVVSSVCAGSTFSIPITITGCPLPSGATIQAYDSYTNTVYGSATYVTGTNTYTITGTAPLGLSQYDDLYVNIRTSPVNYFYSSSTKYVSITNNDAAITVTASPDFISGCSTSQLNVSTKTTLSDNFNSGQADYTNDWSNMRYASVDDNCGAASGYALVFSNDYYTYSARYAMTKNMDVSGGGTIAFSLRMPTGTTSGCENADAGEDVFLEYSTNDGSSWTTIATYSATVTTYANFTSISVAVPTAARTFKTRFRWIQYIYNELSGDNWALDNVSITGTSSLTYAWTPTATLSSSTIKNPIATPAATTTYSVKVTSPNITCAASENVTVQVGNLTGVDLTKFTYYGTSSGKHYYSSNSTATWATAKTNCEASCGNLVAINSSAEQTYVQNILPTSNRHIGLSDATTEGTYTWVTGEAMSYTNWGSGQPNAPTAATDYNRMIANSHTWDDREGTDLYRYILERKANQTIVTSTSTPTVMCSGANYTIAYTANGAFDVGNVFTVQLSNSSGSFSSPTVLATLTTNVSGTIPVTIPALANTTSGYRIRVVSSSPAINGSSNGTNITIIGGTPTVTTVSPLNAPAGSIVTISGANFSPSGNTVSFNGIAASVMTESSTQIKVVVPSGSCPGDLVVTTTCGASTAGYPYDPNSTPVIAGVVDYDSPLKLNITGSGFSYSGNTVTIAGQAATIFYQSPTLIKVDVPVGLCSGQVMVTNVCGISSTPFAFNTTVAPAILSITPVTILPGSTITISGSGFSTSGNTITYAGVPATVSGPQSNSTLQVTLPASVCAGNLIVTNACSLSSAPFYMATSTANTTWYLDADSDGWYLSTQQDCNSPGAGWTSTLPANGSGDCDDNNTSVWRSEFLYIDADGDGYDNGSGTICYGAVQPAGYAANSLGLDCDDNDNAVWQSDTLYVDADSDGYDDGISIVCFGLTPPIGYADTTYGADCNDNDNTVWQTGTFFIDADGDTYDAGTASVCYGASVPLGYSTTTSGDDCDDNDDTKWQIVSLYIDLDADGYDNGFVTLCYSSTVPVGYSATTLGSDCDDADGSVWQSIDGYADADGDGYTVGGIQSICSGVSLPIGYVTSSSGTDCDDSDINIWQSTTLYIDADNDDYDNGTTDVCHGAAIPAGYKLTTLGPDCNDSNPAIFLGGITWYQDVDNDGYYANTQISCINPGAGWTSILPSGGSGDCDDNDVNAWQTVQRYEDTDGDGYGTGSLVTVCFGNAIPAGYSTTNTDCAPSDNTLWQSATLYIDADNDDYDNGTANVCYGASIPVGYKAITLGSDCNDANASIHPAATDVACNGIDEDCSGADAPCLGINTWQGDVAGDETNWHNPGNWSNNVSPNSCADDVHIPFNAYPPTITVAVSVGDIEIDDNVVVTLNDKLSVCGDIDAGNISPAFYQGTSPLEFIGTTPQALSGSLRVHHAVINSTDAVTLQSGSFFDVFNELTLQQGNLNTTAGTLRLLSTGPGHCANINDFGSNTGTLTGNVTAQRYVGGAGNDQHQIGVPVATTLSQLGASGTPGFYIPSANCDETLADPNSPYGTVFEWHENRPNSLPSLDCISDGWEVKSPAAAAQAAKGYSVYLNGGSTLNVTGAPNLAASYSQSGTNGGYNLPTLQSSGVYSFDGGWNLYSNPFPSGYTYTAQAGFNALGFIYVPSGPYSGSYQPLTPGMILAPFQGIMLQVTTPGSTPAYTFSKANRVLSGATVFYQNSNAETLEIEVSGNGYMDKTQLGFNAQRSDQFDSDFDLRKQRSNLGQPTVFTGDNTFPYAVNSKTGITQTATVDMGLIPGANGTFTFTVNGIGSFDPTSYIYLEDKVTGAYQNLRDNNTYTFSMTKTENVNRFVLHFTPKAEITAADANCHANGQIVIEQPGSAEWQYEVENSNAVAVGSGSLNATSPITLSVPAGIYTVTLTDNNGYVVVKQVQVNGSSSITAVGNSSTQIAEVNEDITFSSSTANAVTTVWNFGDGTTANTATATHNYAQEGTYTVTLTVTNADGCSSTLTQTITVNNKTAVGISNITKSNIRMWSSGNKVLVDFSKQKDVQAEIVIYDILGRELSKEPYTKSSIYSKEVLNTEAAYVIVKVMNGDELQTKKLFVLNK